MSSSYMPFARASIYMAPALTLFFFFLLSFFLSFRVFFHLFFRLFFVFLFSPSHSDYLEAFIGRLGSPPRPQPTNHPPTRIAAY
jgi:hypothetical protein